MIRLLLENWYLVQPFKNLAIKSVSFFKNLIFQKFFKTYYYHTIEHYRCDLNTVNFFLSLWHNLWSFFRFKKNSGSGGSCVSGEYFTKSHCMIYSNLVTNDIFRLRLAKNWFDSETRNKLDTVSLPSTLFEPCLRSRAIILLSWQGLWTDNRSIIIS